jgi:hypothetical protein
MAIDRIECRATVSVGGLSVSTPFVQSFSVRKQRGQISTFDASLKVSHSEVNSAITGDSVKIYAGSLDTGTPLIFTGIVRQAKISPCFDDPKYVILSISGADVLSLLNGKKYTRRCRSSKAAWAAITSVARKGLKSGKFAYKNESVMRVDSGELNKESALSVFQANNQDNTVTAAVPGQTTESAAVGLRVEIVDDTTDTTGSTTE